MTSYDDREKGFERKFALDGELAFKATARRNKLLGLWAAAELGKAGAEADAYAKEVIMAYFEREGDEDIVEKLLSDFAAAQLKITARDIRAEMVRLAAVARKEVTEGAS